MVHTEHLELCGCPCLLHGMFQVRFLEPLTMHALASLSRPKSQSYRLAPDQRHMILYCVHGEAYDVREGVRQSDNWVTK